VEMIKESGDFVTKRHVYPEDEDKNEEDKKWYIYQSMLVRLKFNLTAREVNLDES
jgi:hypothetical protein